MFPVFERGDRERMRICSSQVISELDVTVLKRKFALKPAARSTFVEYLIRSAKKTEVCLFLFLDFGRWSRCRGLWGC